MAAFASAAAKKEKHSHKKTQEELMSGSRPRLEDLSIIVSGQGGDGSLTVINILADALRSVGFRAYTERDVLSRIKGAS